MALKFLLLNRVETAEDLSEIAVQGTKEVTVLEMLEKTGKDIGKSTRWVIMSDLSRYNVKTVTEAKALKISESSVTVERDGKVEEIPCDTVVMATGSVPENSIKESLDKLGITYEITGDAKQIGLAFHAVHDGFAAGRAI